MHKLGFRFAALSLSCLALAGACGESSSSPDSGQPTTCEPQTFTLRSLDGFDQCCESQSPSPLGEGLTSCDASGTFGSGGEASLGEGGLGGNGGSAPALGGSSGEADPAWVILTHAFESDWEGGSDVCLHLTSTGSQVSGDATIYAQGAGDACAAPGSSRLTHFIATPSATAYVCLNTGGPVLESPGTGALLAVAFRFREGSAESLRVDAIDVKKDACPE